MGLRFLVYLDSGTPRRWRWTLFAANNRKIANSGESYHNYDDCEHAINLVASSDGAPIQLSPDAQARLRRIAQLAQLSRRTGR